MHFKGLHGHFVVEVAVLEGFRFWEAVGCCLRHDSQKTSSACSKGARKGVTSNILQALLPCGSSSREPLK